MSHLTMIRGDTKAFSISLTDAVGDALDLTGMAVTFTAKGSFADSDANATIVKMVGDGIVIDDPTSGEAVLTILPEDTEDFVTLHHLYFDVQVVDSFGSVNTAAAGVLEVKPDITQTATSPES